MNFVRNSNLPEKKAAYVICNGDICETVKSEFNLSNIKTFLTLESPSLQESVNSHPDMQLFYCGDGKIIVAPDVYDNYYKYLTNLGLTVIKGETVLKNKYPYDIAYNACLIGDKLFCNEKYTDLKIKEFAREKNYKIIDISQGYAKCSICVVSENAIITEDKGIYNKAVENNIKCLLLEKKEAYLRGYEYGFIGGASGKLSKNILAFFGDISKHSHYEKIRNFCKEEKVEIISFSAEKLIDFGSIIPVLEVNH